MLKKTIEKIQNFLLKIRSAKSLSSIDGVGLLFGFSVVIIAFSAVFLFLMFMSDSIRRKAGNKYAIDVIAIHEMSQDDASIKIEENFYAARSPVYKLLWGLRLIESLKNNGDFENQAKVIRKLIKIGSLPNSIKTVLKIELGNILLYSGNTSGIEKLFSSVSSSNPLWSMIAEVKMNMLLSKNDFIGYESLSKHMLLFAPKNLYDRTSETLYAIKYQNIW